MTEKEIKTQLEKLESKHNKSIYDIVRINQLTFILHEIVRENRNRR